MKHIRCILGLFLLPALLLVGCVEPINRSLSNDQLKEGIPICFCVQTDNMGITTKAGPVSGTDATISQLFMYCFDSNGRFLGRFEATKSLGGAVGVNSQGSIDATTGRGNDYGTFYGTIPPATDRIHFVANADRPVGNDKIGLKEEAVMHSETIGVCSDPETMAYWGYLCSNDTQDLVSLFTLEAEEGQMVPSTTVYLLRDRLWIKAGTCEDNNIVRNDPQHPIKWVVYNGLKRGYIAAFSQSGTDEFPYQMDYYDADLSADAKVTPFPDQTGGNSNRFRSDGTDADWLAWENRMELFDTDHPMFAFDDHNYLENAIRIILSVYFKHGTTYKKKFFPVTLTKEDSPDQQELRRGHLYQLDIAELSEVMGKDTFREAALATSFANGQIVDIPDEVIEVSDGTYMLRSRYQLEYPLAQEIVYSTAVLYQENEDGDVTVPFELLTQNGNTPGNTVTFAFDESRWIEKDEGLLSSETVGRAYNNTTGKGELTFHLKASGNSIKIGEYKLRAYYTTVVNGKTKKHVLERNILIYSVKQFELPKEYNGAKFSITKITTDSQDDVDSVVGDYRLKFTLPSGVMTYPHGLYPLQIKMASRTLQPYRSFLPNSNKVMTQMGETVNNNFVDAVFGVQVRSTVPGTYITTTDAPYHGTANPPYYGTSFTGSSYHWDYQLASKPWNFWYTYSITSELVDTSENPIEKPEIYFDFKDVRSKTSGVGYNETASDLGLYLYLEFFGTAIPISITP